MGGIRMVWLVLLAGLVGQGTAYAHTRLDRADPAPDAVLDAPPSRIHLIFTTAFDLPPDAVVVLGPDGARVDRNDAAVDPDDPRALAAGVDAARPGTYTVRWSVLSRDGHPVRGEYRFTVAKPAPPAAPAEVDGPAADGSPVEGAAGVESVAGASGATPTPPAGAAGGAAGSLGLAAGLGLHLLGLALALAPIVLGLLAADAGDAALRRRLWQASVAGALVLLVAAAGTLLVRAAALGGSPAAAFRPALLAALLAGGWGRLWIARLLLSLVLLAMGAVTLARLRGADRRTESLRPEAGGLAAGLLLFLLTSSGGHAAAAEPAWLFILLDWVHLGAAMAWAGGLIVIATVIFPEIRHRTPGEQVRLLGALVPRFSSMAAGCVVVLALTGLLPAWANVGGPSAIFASDYGRALAAKLFIVAAVMAPAAYNRFAVKPMLARVGATTGDAPDADARALVHRFRRSIVVEATLGATILVLAALLASLPPAE